MAGQSGGRVRNWHSASDDRFVVWWKSSPAFRRLRRWL